MKYTLLVTQRCNLACDYCYVGKRPESMALPMAARIVDFAFQHTPDGEPVEFGFFGGEPLLELDLIRDITEYVEAHRAFAPQRVSLTIVTNGTIFNTKIADFLEEHRIVLGISCDGRPEVHDVHRRTLLGHGSAHFVERTIRAARARFSRLMVNAVYGPDTLHELPKAVEYFSSLGVRQIYLSPNFSAQWREIDAARLSKVYGTIGEWYRRSYRAGDRHFISLLDAKIAVILRDGYQLTERCQMGQGEFAFTPAGYVYPCERLVGADDERHRIGSVSDEVRLDRILCASRTSGGESATNAECRSCALRPYCMCWCGCSNYFSTGRYDRAGPFLCASERAAIQTALDVIRDLDSDGAWYDHASGMPHQGSEKGLAERPTPIVLPMV